MSGIDFVWSFIVLSAAILIPIILKLSAAKLSINVIELQIYAKVSFIVRLRKTLDLNGP